MHGMYPKARLAAALCLMLGAQAAQAMIINETTFVEQGGNLADVAGSIKYANDALREQSFAPPYLAVGTISSGCTATWIGDDDEGWSYILTAAHCLPYKGEQTPINTTFKAWNGAVIATGAGTAYVPKVRINRPAGMGGASTDIGLIKLPTRDIILDQQGNPITPPVLYDGSDERKRPVHFVGYGAWGVGATSNGSYGPATGPRRLYGESIIDSIFELDHGIDARYVPKGKTKQWARLAPGDSGSAWWQTHQGMEVIIATTNGGGTLSSTGARVSKYIPWLTEHFPGLRRFSEVLAKEQRGCIRSLRTGEQYCLPAGERSGYVLPSWIDKHEVEVNAAPGTKVLLSDWANLSYNRIGVFVGSVGQEGLKQVKAWNGQVLDFSRPRSMRVSASTVPVGCVIGTQTREAFCLAAGQQALTLPASLAGQEVYVKADPGVRVTLSDVATLAAPHTATFTGVVEAAVLREARDATGQPMNLSRPQAMRVSTGG